MGAAGRSSAATVSSVASTTTDGHGRSVPVPDSLRNARRMAANDCHRSVRLLERWVESDLLDRCQPSFEDALGGVAERPQDHFRCVRGDRRQQLRPGRDDVVEDPKGGDLGRKQAGGGQSRPDGRQIVTPEVPIEEPGQSCPRPDRVTGVEGADHVESHPFESGEERPVLFREMREAGADRDCGRGIVRVRGGLKDLAGDLPDLADATGGLDASCPHRVRSRPRGPGCREERGPVRIGEGPDPERFRRDRGEEGEAEGDGGDSPALQSDQQLQKRRTGAALPEEEMERISSRVQAR